ncbi:exodeoxyribonuclease VII large subunit [Clostridium oryzae]|uniref:Exodeoxyribonuclease 7 large subunit n=1 Tax=Clostridium oryzae TaxID=1450648 RepID=A0A1V4ITR7_9CLOT|nr:exodeoxyribonuclease VII large subunit [Clostridium oryzae]OPJ63200.1 exodeoxyribonuclease 7 large subunit [Clostridium oryzae]
MYIKVLTVSALNNYIKKMMDNDIILMNIHVKGEISNFKIHSSGHIYFSLKDDDGKINCVMFRTDAEQLEFIPENGMQVEVAGRISVYIKDGSYQLYCNKIMELGMGELYARFIQLKEKLSRDGLFNEEHKRPIPLFPRRIGVITSPTGAAIRDIINVSTRRNKNVNILLYPSVVQGKAAASDIIKGIEVLNQIEDIDVIIVARGGGSVEELWSFNDEQLAYAVYNSSKPIITGVGHETDFTIVDFVSDRRAPTPSAAAEVAVPFYSELENQFFSLQNRLMRSYGNIIERKKSDLAAIERSLQLNSPMNYIVNGYTYIDNLRNRLYSSINNKLAIKKEQLVKYSALLEAHNPLKVLERGYSIIQDNNNKVINEIEQLKKQNEVLITLKDGSIKTFVSFKGE